MKTELHRSRPTGFWRTVRLLLGAARRRAAGRKSRKGELLEHRTGKSTDPLTALAFIGMLLWMLVVNVGAAFAVQSAVSAGQHIDAAGQGKIVVQNIFFGLIRDIETMESEEAKKLLRDLLNEYIPLEAEHRVRKFGGSKEAHEKQLRDALWSGNSSVFIGEASGISQLAATGPFPAMLGSLGLLWWLVMMMSQAEGLGFDFQRRRHPMWEWLFSHPVPPGAVFMAEMLSPIVVNPIYLTGPVFFGVLYGFIYGAALGLAAALLVGVPITIATACLGKAVEIGVMLRFSHVRADR
jgi:hypothetical protein